MAGRSTQYQSLEDESIDNHTDKLEDNSKSIKQRISYTTVTFIFSIAVLSALAYTSNSLTKYNQSALRNSASSFVELSDSSSISYTFARKGYRPIQYFEAEKKNYLSESFLKDYVAVIEPYADMSLTFLEDSDSSDDDHHYTFSVCDSSNICYNGKYIPSSSDDGSTVNIGCTPHTLFTVTVKEHYGAKVARQSTSSAICMYVRREITDLLDDDLTTTMDAMYTLWNLSDEDGKKKYGENYHSAGYFTAAHDFNAAQQDADHIHEGLGFLLQHIKLTNMFESAVQVVNPSVTIPYWDFTRDVAAGKTIYESYIFSEKTFGSINRPKDAYWGFTYRNDNLEDTAIPNGRWKHLKADKNIYPDLNNGFGYMRGPWNTNPSPYVSRFSAYSPSLPSCSDYYGGLGLPSFKDTLKTAPYGAHASTHGVIGAVYGCDKLDDFREDGIIKDEDSQLAICKKWGFYMKELYRANYLAPRSDCSQKSLAYDDVDCGFECNADTYDNMVNQIKTTISSNYLKSGVSNDDYTRFRDFICHGDASRIFVGDHLESASPSDPSFWVIHPTQERLFQAKLLIHAFTDLTSSAWPSDAVNDYVCDKPKCFNANEGKKDYYEDCCYGHYENDQLLDFESGDRSKRIGPTNKEIFHGTDLSRPEYSMNYVYDNFQWNHCNEDFEGKLTTSYAMSISKPIATGPSSDGSSDSSPVSKSQKPPSKPK
jgi:hypothetical protein